MTSTIKVNTITTESGSTLTVGGCGKTVALASGASQTGFGRTGTVDWDTTPKTATFTAVSGDGFFANTTGSAFNMNLPAGVAGAIVSVADYAGTWQTNNLTVVPNGTDKIGSVNTNVVLNTQGQSVTFLFVDSTQGWVNIQDSTSNERGNSFLTASGGTESTSGDFKIHTFTGPGTFTVSGIGGTAANNVVSYMVVAGGASGGASYGGGGGAGGFREYKSPVDSYTASPLNGNPGGTEITVTSQGYPITVGAGGASRPGSPSSAGAPGSNSIFSTVTSAGGGGGGAGVGAPYTALNGGSGGGVGRDETTNNGDGNTPPTSPPQGNDGGTGAGTSWNGGGGGGGATTVGGNGSGGAPCTETAGNGGTGATTSINATPTVFAGGGGGSIAGSNCSGGTGGPGGGGAGHSPSRPVGVAGTANTGGAGGGGHDSVSGAGGSGIVIIRYKYQ
jgi:hypothetical protein